MGSFSGVLIRRSFGAVENEWKNTNLHICYFVSESIGEPVNLRYPRLTFVIERKRTMEGRDMISNRPNESRG